MTKTKEEAKEKLRELVDKFSNYSKERLDSMPEEDIKFQFIEPFLEILGWKKEEISKEPRVLKGRADYILRIGNQDKLVIEAKKTNVHLTEDQGRQSVSYAYHRKIKFSVLTNFKYLKVYHALSNIKNIDKNLLKINNQYFTLEYKEFLDKFDVLWLLSRDSFESGEINKLLSSKDERINKPIDENILADLLNIRGWLSKELKSKKNYLSQEVIDEIVQIIIDRLIFIRSVEDRGLEPMNYLRSLESDVRQQRTKLQLYPYLLEKFEEFNKKYDSKLFEKGLLEKEGSFSDDVLRKVILALYFGSEGNQERYLFDQIPGDLFGSIYEQYLGTILSGTEKRVKLEGGTGKRKKMGIYYTPSYIVDYIVKNTVGEYIKDKGIDEILNVKILDPACGSGSFITRAFSEVCETIKEKLNKDEEGSKILFKKQKGKIEELNMGQKIEILRSCIYGVDLDEKAVELARLNLLLKLLEGETQESKKLLLPHLENNIKNGNSLIDDSKVAGDKAFKWEVEFSDIFRNGGFDVVIGNPPYIDSEEMVKTQPKVRQYCSLNYETAKGNWDIFGVFIEKGLKLLKENGLFGEIIPNKLLSAKYTEILRKFIENKMQIISIRDYSKISVFSASVYPIVIIIKNNFNGENKILTEIMKSYGEDVKIDNTNTINQKELINSSEKTWAYIFEKEGRGQLDKILKNSKPLEDLAEVKGSATVSEAYELKKKIKNLSADKDYFKFVNTGTIDRYSLLWKNSKTQYIKDSYLKPIIIKKDLKKLYPRRILESSNPKIIIAGMTKILECGLDERGEYLAGKSTTLAIPSKIDIKLLLAILNSKLMTYIYKNLFKSLSLSGGYMRIGPPQIKTLPIHLPSSPQQEQHIISLVNEMLELQKQLHEKKPVGHEKGNLERQIKNTDYEIDQEVYKLYGITKEEQKIIEGSLK